MAKTATVSVKIADLEPVKRELNDLRLIVAVLFQNSHRCDADYFLTAEQRAKAEQVSAEIGEVEVRE